MKLKFLYKTTIPFILFSLHLIAKTQVCTGSLGDPSINVTFGSGANPGNQLNSSTTTYNFTNSICPIDGSYTIVNSTAGCFSNSWHNITEDHTPNDVNGYMMLVNASVNPGDFYVDTVKNLCPNTTYEFAAWIMNVLAPIACNGNFILPKLIFNIETTTGKVLGTYNTGNMPATSTPQWKQYGLFFTTPLNINAVVLRLTNTAPGGCGNDIALDDITFRPCGPSVTTSVTNNSLPVLDFCKGMTTNVPITAAIGVGYIAPEMQWQNSADNGKTWTDIAGETTLSYLFNNTATGVYTYRLSVAESGNINTVNCRVASKPIIITIHDQPIATATGNSPVCEKQLINLTATGGDTYAWSGPAGFTSTLSAPSLIAKTNTGGVYTVTVTSKFGCTDVASFNVTVNLKPIAAIDNVPGICEGSNVTLQASGGVSYLWSPDKGLSNVNIDNPVASPIDVTTYQVSVTNANNCTDTANLTLNVFKKPVANAGADKIIVKGQSVILDGFAAGGNVSFSWSPNFYMNDPQLIKPTVTPLNDFQYTLVVTSNNGCGTASDDVLVKVYKDIYIPSAFSPNDDGLNDTWVIQGIIAVPNATVSVFNRFGKIVFETTGNQQQWDGNFNGTPSPTGSYTYLINLKNGSPLRKGTLMIVR